jgi:CheY-like chemotaxis protein
MKTVLIIDDSNMYRVLLSQYFEAAGWRVHQAASGNSGLKVAREVLPPYIICDMVMPDGDGISVVRGVRADPQLQDTKIVIFTGRDEAANREAALAAGADGYLVKPVESSAILAQLEKFEKSKTQPTNV